MELTVLHFLNYTHYSIKIQMYILELHLQIFKKTYDKKNKAIKYTQYMTTAQVHLQDLLHISQKLVEQSLIQWNPMQLL